MTEPGEDMTQRTADDGARPLALVTGASSGIGLELAKELAGRGYDLVVNAEDDAIWAVPGELSVSGGHAFPVQADLSTFDGVERLISEIQTLDRPLEVAALNAGVGVSGDFAQTVSLEADLDLIALNVVAPVHLAKRLLPDMVDRGQGRVLLTSSVAATMPGPYYATYAASKAFVQSFAQAIRHELDGTGVSVTALQPGPTDTNFFERAGMEGTKADEGGKADPADVARAGIDALLAGEDHVVTGGAKVKAQVAASRFLTEPMRAGLQAQQTQPGSAEQADEPS